MLSSLRGIIYSKVGMVVTFGVLIVIALAFAAGDVTGQIQRIQSGRQRGSCVIGISAVDSSAVAPALDAARERFDTR